MQNQSIISRVRKILSLCMILGLAACAPDLGPLTQPRADLTASGEDKTEYPQSNWWETYVDPQLSAMIAEGLKNSPSIAEAAARMRSANAAAQVQGAALAPNISADGSIQKYRQSYNEGVPSAFIPHGFQTTASAQLNFNYELDFWGKNHDAVAAALSEAKAAELDAEQAKMILSTSIASAYADLAQLYAELDAAEASVAVHQKTAALFAERFTIGLENQGAVEQEKAKEAGIEIERATIQESIGLKKNALAALMGAVPARAESITRPELEHITTLGMPSVIPADLIARRPDLMAATERMQAAARRINVAHAGYYPNVNLAAYIGHQSLGLDTFLKNSSTIGAIGPAIHLPIFEGGELEGNYRGARADYDASVAGFESAIIEALHQVADAATSQQSLALRAQKTLDAFNAAQRSFDITNNRYRGGLGTYINVLNAEDTLILSRFALADIRTRGFALDVALVKALGGGYMPQETTSEPNKETTP